jgi:predicted dienelactone hydrolase
MAGNVGLANIEVADPDGGPTLPLSLLYPTRAAARRLSIGPYEIETAPDAPVEGSGLRLVAISHGQGGAPWVYRDLASRLVRAGFVVALPEHLGDSRRDGRLTGTAEILVRRPRQLELAIDAAFADPRVGPAITPDGVGVIGHSMGGYTALAVAGGRPIAFPGETQDGLPRLVDVKKDPRVRALALLAPAAGWVCHPGALEDVHAAVMIRVGEHDDLMLRAFADLVRRGLPRPDAADFAVVPGAGHFSFLSPFPPAMASPDFPPAQDPPGFDRVAYGMVLADEIAGFLRRTLG